MPYATLMNGIRCFQLKLIDLMVKINWKISKNIGILSVEAALVVHFSKTFYLSMNQTLQSKQNYASASNCMAVCVKFDLVMTV